MSPAKQAIIDADVSVDGHFILADGGHATQKLEMDRLWDHPAQLATILDLLAEADGLPAPDLILGVPSGGQRLAIELVDSGRVKSPIARLERVPGGAKQDFRFATPADAALAKKARTIRIYEDVVTTLSSIAGVVKLLDPIQQQIDSLSIWRRGEVKADYRRGLTDHYLIEDVMPSFSADECPYPGCYT
jgi:orotate phosphoribosyltransferase